MKLYAVKNIEEGTYLNYAEKKRKVLSKGWRFYSTHSPFPTLRPKEHIKKHFEVWIINTCYPEKYRIVEFNEPTKFVNHRKDAEVKE